MRDRPFFLHPWELARYTPRELNALGKYRDELLRDKEVTTDGIRT